MDCEVIEKQMVFVHDNFFDLSNGMEVEGARHFAE
jgi:hypothetical protein